MDENATRTKIRCRPLLGLALLACSLAVAAPGAADGAGTSYVALGDSFTSAPLTGASASGVPVSCQQSTNNYPHLVAAAIGARSLTDVSCSGAVLANLTQPQPQTNLDGLSANPPQLDAVMPSTTLVTIGISANDASIFGVAYQCFTVDLLEPTGSACEDQYTAGGVDPVTQTIGNIAPELAAAYQGIHARAPQARVLAVGYPALLPVNGTSCWPLLPLSPDDVSFLASLLVQLNTMIATTAAANGVQYVDTYAPTIGHDVCQPSSRAGFTAVLPTAGLSLPLHPDALGEQLMADAVLQAIDDPPVAKPQAPANPRLRLTTAAIGRRSVTAAGTISRAYRGSVAITFQARSHGRAVDLHRTTKVARGRFHATLRIPTRYRGVLHAGTLVARSHANNGLAAGTARAHIRDHVKAGRTHARAGSRAAGTSAAGS
jgi:lysophospholipase L1-like esterase